MSYAVAAAEAVGLALILAALGVALFGAGVVVGGGSRPRAGDKEVRITAAVATALSVLAVVAVASGVEAGGWIVGISGLTALTLWFVTGLRSTTLGEDWQVSYWGKQDRGGTTATLAKATEPATTRKAEQQTAAARKARLEADRAEEEAREAEAQMAEARASADKTRVKCFKCEHRQWAAVGVSEFHCENCGAKLRRSKK